MSKNSESPEEVVNKFVFVLAFKDGRRLYFTEYHDYEQLRLKMLTLLNRRIQFRVEYRDLTEEEAKYYETI